MSVTLSASVRLRVSHSGTVAFKASGIESRLGQTWFIFGTKRTTGAPTTVADLIDTFASFFFDYQGGSFVWGDTASVNVLGRIGRGSDFFPSSLAGDHLYLVVTHGSSDPPAPEATFDAVLPVGTLKA